MNAVVKKPKSELVAAMNAAMLEKPAPTADLLARIITSAHELTQAEKAVDALEEQLKDAKALVLRLRTTALPSLLDEAGVPGLDVDAVTRIE